MPEDVGLICCNNGIVCLKIPKINEKDAMVGPVFCISDKNHQMPNFQKWIFRVFSNHVLLLLSLSRYRSKQCDQM